MRITSLATLCVVLSSACSDTIATESAPYIEDGSPEAIGILGLLDSETADRHFLDTVVGLDSRAVSHLVAHRDGADRMRGTADDAPYTSMVDVEGTRFVGYAALDTLVEWSDALGFTPGSSPAPVTVEGVTFDALQGAAALEFANTASTDDLVRSGMDRRAVTGIVEARPFPHLWAVGDAWYVGPTALEALRHESLLEDVAITDMRFTNDLREAIVDLYDEHGAALEADGAVPVAVALAGVHVRRSDMMDTTDPWGHSPDEAALYRHPCPVFPDSKRTWYGAYAWDNGEALELYWFEAH